MSSDISSETSFNKKEKKDGFSNTSKYKIDSFYKHCGNHNFFKKIIVVLLFISETSDNDGQFTCIETENILFMLLFF